jgi:glyoxylase-like metal-dependent hydrolase (beta-lactamase superfamily II)
LAFLAAGCLPELPYQETKTLALLTPPPAPTGIRKIPLSFSVDIVNNRRVKSVKMEVFRAGGIKVRGEAVSSLKSYHSKIEMDVPVFLIRHSSAGIILVGTGLSTEKTKRKENILDTFLPYAFKYRLKRKEDIVTQLARAGVAADEIKWILLPYLDVDTAGMLEAFPAAAVVASRAEWEYRKSIENQTSYPKFLSPSALEGRLKVELADVGLAPAFGSFENGLDFFGDGSVYLVALPGRTPGNIGVWANLDEGPVLLTGGAAYVVDNYLDRALPVKGKLTDLEDYWRSLHIIRAMRKAMPRLQIFAGSDLSSLAVPRRDDLTLRTRKK